jgi:Raf kinase inhibitor-like YbhB/YbcL family protein
MSFKVNNISKDRIVAVDQRLDLLFKKEAFKINMPTIFSNLGIIPSVNLRDNANESPEISWYGAPSNTVEFVLIMYDQTVDFTHWIVYGMAPSKYSLPADASTSLTKLGTNDFDRVTYEGPQPPAGINHVYVFTLYALSKELAPTTNEPTRSEILRAMNGSIIVTTETTGMYEETATP